MEGLTLMWILRDLKLTLVALAATSFLPTFFFFLAKSFSCRDNHIIAQCTGATMPSGSKGSKFGGYAIG